MVHRIVVVGAGYSGLTAAQRLAGRARDARVVLVNDGDRFVERVRLHQLAAGQDLPEHALADILRGSGVELLVARVLAIDPQQRELQLDPAAASPWGTDGRLGYDTLVLAAGSGPDAQGVPGGAEHALAVSRLDGAQELAKRIPDLAAAHAALAVVGGGLTGIETATELAECHPDLRVHLISATEPGAGLSPRARAHLRRAFARLGVEVHTGVAAEVRPDAVVLADGATVPSDLTVWATGFSVPQLAAQAGIATDERGRVRVDEEGRSVSHPDVHAVGDNALGRTPRGDSLRMSCATGLPTGRHLADVIADRLAGREPRPLRFRYYIQCISLGRRDGIIQFVDADDRPHAFALTGAAAARVKEMVVRGALWTARNPGPYPRRRRAGGAGPSGPGA